MTALGFLSPGSMQQSISEPMWGGGIMTPNDTCLWLRAKGTCHVTTVTALLDRAAPCGYTFATTFSGSLMLFILLSRASTMRGRWERLCWAAIVRMINITWHHVSVAFAAGNLRVGNSLLSLYVFKIVFTSTFSYCQQSLLTILGLKMSMLPVPGVWDTACSPCDIYFQVSVKIPTQNVRVLEIRAHLFY